METDVGSYQSTVFVSTKESAGKEQTAQDSVNEIMSVKICS